jgi:type IV pilus assembly protein PilM
MSIMLVAVGAAKNPMNLMPQEFSQKKVKKISLAIPGTILAAGVAISIAMFAYGQISYSIEKSNRDELQKKLDDMQQYVQIKERYDGSLSVYNTVMGMSAQTQNMNQYLVAFIEELEEKMPDTFKAVSLSATEDGVSMGVTVSTMTEAAEVIQQLRSFETISTITSSGFTVSGDTDEDAETDGEQSEDGTENGEEQEPTVSFSLTLTYNLNYGISETETDAAVAE